MSQEIVMQLVENPKTGQAIAAATVASGVGTWTNYIPTDVGKIATLVGIALSLVVIYVTVQRERRERRQAERENEVHQFDMEERRRRVDARRAAGLPTRRSEDEPTGRGPEQ